MGVRPVFGERTWIPEQISTAVTGLKMERQLWNEGRGGLLSTHLPVGETNANHLLSYQFAIQHLAEKEPVSDAGVCYSRQFKWQSDCFLSSGLYMSRYSSQPLLKTKLTTGFHLFWPNVFPCLLSLNVLLLNIFIFISLLSLEHIFCCHSSYLPWREQLLFIHWKKMQEYDPNTQK